MVKVKTPVISVENIYKAKLRLKSVAEHTPLLQNLNWSEKYDCNIWFKREDLQVVRSYKIRGAYNKMSMMSETERAKGVVCASAGNHAQGVAFACRLMNTQGTIFMPSTTPQQKVTKVKFFGRDKVEVILIGDTYDDSYQEALIYSELHAKEMIHPFDDERVIEGQGTVGLEILEDCPSPIDYVFLPLGGGGLAAGLGSYFKQMSPKTQIIGVEPSGAASMYESLKQGEVVRLPHIDKFVDGAAVQQVGYKTFQICKVVLDDVVTVAEGKVCTTILQLYNEEAIVVEPAGALSITILDDFKAKIKGKNVVCIISGGNNDITRTEEIKERSLLYEGLKHYFIIQFPQRAGALRDFLNYVLGKDDDITRFEYIKKTNRENGPALIGVEVKCRADYEAMILRMEERQIRYKCLEKDPDLFRYLI
ncbi:MAG: threonine ammonia-lyase [Bacteroidota bacterium]